MNKIELKIFLTFFIIYFIFVHWIGWNENSRFNLVSSIVDEKKFEIDSYYNNTGDRAYYNRHYYSDKEPGVSLISVSIYYILKAIHVNSNLNQIILLTVFTSTLFGALSVVLIYKISKFFTKNSGISLLTSFTFGLGTLIFPYAIIYQDLAISTFFVLFAFYLIFKLKQEKNDHINSIILGGLLSSFAISITLLTSVIWFLLLLYTFSINKRMIAYFILSSFLSLLPLLIYNYVIFETPFTLPRLYLDQEIWSHIEGVKGIKSPNVFVMARILFFPERGLLFYYPIFVFSFLGVFSLFKKFKIEALLISALLIAFIVINSSWWAWWGGVSFGPRHLVPITPFLTLPLIFIISKYKHSRIITIPFYLALSISVLTNFASLQITIDDLSNNSKTDLKPEFKTKINSFEIISNPLNEYYFPLFFKYGPRSPIIENLLDGHINIDIRDTPLSRNWQFPYVAKNHIPFLSLVIVGMVVAIIWNKEILAIGRKKFPSILKFKQ
jgi:hypothetical protein